MLPVVFGPLAARSAPDDLARVSLLVLGVLGTGAWLIIMRRALAERVPKGIAFAIAGIAFYDASVVAFADWRAAVACLACFVLTLALQRVVPAT
jgi:4-hydroxybenzoate polyprenyltransferase